MLFIVNLLIKTDSTIICVPCMLEHVFMIHFLSKIADLQHILCQLVKFCVLSEIHASKSRFKQLNENLRLNIYARMFWEHVYKIFIPLAS